MSDMAARLARHPGHPGHPAHRLKRGEQQHVGLDHDGEVPIGSVGDDGLNLN